MTIQHTPKQLVETLLRLCAIEASLVEDMLDGAVTAADNADALSSKIETIRRQIRQEADDVTVESMQQLTSLLRQCIHTITDLVYAKAARGENTASMAKLQNMLMKIVSGLATNGEEDGDANGDGFRDDVEITDVTDGDEGTSDVQDALNQALKHAKKVDDAGFGKDEPEADDPADDAEEPAAKPAPKAEAPKKAAPAPKPAQKQEAEPDAEEPSEDAEAPEDGEGDDGDGGYDSFMSDLIDSDAEEDDKPKKGKAKAGDDLSLEDFAFDTPEDDSEDEATPVTASVLVDSIGHVTTAGLRVMYHGVRKIKLAGGKPVDSIKISIGDTKRDSDKMTAYYYVINKSAPAPFMGGDYKQANNAMLKLLRTSDGYAALTTQVNKMVREKTLDVAGRIPTSLADAVNDSPECFWAFDGIAPHPKNDKKVAIWVELGAKRYALVGATKIDESELGSISAYLKAVLVGGANNRGTGMPYTEAYDLVKKLVTEGFIRGMKTKLKTIFIGDV